MVELDDLEGFFSNLDDSIIYISFLLLPLSKVYAAKIICLSHIVAEIIHYRMI